MRTVYKYTCEFSHKLTYEIPAFSKIVKVEFEEKNKNIIAVWAEVETEMKEEVKEEFFVYGTGHEIDRDNIEHYTTLQKDGFVWHLYKAVTE